MIKCPLRRPSAQENKIKCPLWDFPFSHAVSEPLLCWFAFPLAGLCETRVRRRETKSFFFFSKCLFRLQLFSSFVASSRASAEGSSVYLLRPSSCFLTFKSNPFCFYSPKITTGLGHLLWKMQKKWNVFYYWIGRAAFIYLFANTAGREVCLQQPLRRLHKSS